MQHFLRANLHSPVPDVKRPGRSSGTQFFRPPKQRLENLMVPSKEAIPAGVNLTETAMPNLGESWTEKRPDQPERKRRPRHRMRS
jgi:hypothetical protein